MPLSPEAPAFTPRKRLNGSGPPQVGQVCRVPTSLPQGPLSSCRFLSFPQSPTTGRPWSGRGWGRGTLSTPSPGQTLGKRSPTTAVLPLPSPRISSRSATMNQSPGERVPGGQLPSGRPQCLAPHLGRDFPSPPLSRSQRRNSSSFPLGGRHSTPQSQLFTPSGKLLGRRGPPESFPGKIRPSHSVNSYNDMGVAGDKPGSVMSMRVVFFLRKCSVMQDIFSVIFVS